MELLNLSALEIADKISRHELTVEAVVRFFIDRIKKYESLNCISALFEDDALDKARKLDILNSESKPLSQFHGIPVLLKDNLDVEGYITKAGTTYLSNIAQGSCTLVQQLESLGFIILGKVKMTELAFGLSGQNPIQGTPLNPWSKKPLAPGGSSSGSCVAVAAGLIPLSIGGDTGGSIRAPAALNGIFGFKPSKDRISSSGVVPLSKTLDVLGPVSLRGEDIFELYPLLSNTNISERYLNQKEIYYLAEEDFPYPLDNEISKLWNEFLEQLEKQGFSLRKWQLPTDFNFERLSNFTSTIIAYESYLYHGKDAENKKNKMWEVVRDRVLRGKTIPLEDYQEAIKKRSFYQKVFKDSLIKSSLLLLPISPTFAMQLDPEDTKFTHVGHYTRPFNYLNAPCFTIPIGKSSANLPTGVQLVSYENNEYSVLKQAELIIDKLNIKPTVADT